MRVLIVGLNYAPEQIGVAVYTTGLAKMLAATGHEVHVIAGRPYYPGWQIMPGHSAWTYSRGDEHGVDVTRVPHYIPRLPTGMRRVLHHASFATSALLPAVIRALTWRPHLLLTIAPALIAAPVGLLAARLSGAHGWLHLQDFEIETAVATGLIGEKPARLARVIERWLVQHFDTVSTISPPMCRRLISMGLPPGRVVEFRNWADVDVVYPLRQASPLREHWNVHTPHIALYSGSIAKKQGLEVIVEAARRLSHRKDLTFVIVGEGPYAATLQQRAAGLDNVRFYPLQPKERLNQLLNLGSIHLLPQIAGAADLVLPSKLNNMLASGRPVIAMTAPGSGLAMEVAGAGLVVAPGDSVALANAVENLISNPLLHQQLSRAARQRAEERWSRQAVLGDIEQKFARCAAPEPVVEQRAPAA